MATRIKLSALKSILAKLDNCYVTVRVPRVSMEILNKHYLEDIDETSIKKNNKMTISEFLGYEDKLSRSARLGYTNQGYVSGYEYEEEPSLDYRDGEAIKKSAMKLRDAYIPISFLIHIYNNGYTIKVPKIETLVLIIQKLEDVLENSAVLLERTNPEILEFIEDFYNAIIDGREEQINALLESKERKMLKDNKSILGFMNKISDTTLDTRSLIREKNGNLRALDLDDLIVK